MIPTDYITAGIEFVNIILMLMNIRKIVIDKQVKGISIYSAMYSWGYSVWFAIFCNELNQPISTFVSTIYSLVNLIWLGLFLYYNFFDSVVRFFKKIKSGTR
ncbi:hypothetical protein RsoM2USA_126 [Ralstonia phage RsoM2USA]|nr:hypothetical protein RsoM2USA_126 [Ralstonia phage RsoM2USA]